MSQKDGPPRGQGTAGSQSSVHIQAVAQPVQGWGWRGMGRSIPALGRVWVGVASGLSAGLTFKPILKCFRNVFSSETSPGTPQGTDATHAPHSLLWGELIKN